MASGLGAVAVAGALVHVMVGLATPTVAAPPPPRVVAAVTVPAAVPRLKRPASLPAAPVTADEPQPVQGVDALTPMIPAARAVPRPTAQPAVWPAPAFNPDVRLEPMTFERLGGAEAVALPGVVVRPWFVANQDAGLSLTLVLLVDVAADGAVTDVQVAQALSDHPDDGFVADWIDQTLTQADRWQLPATGHTRRARLLVERRIGMPPRVHRLRDRQFAAALAP
ncbi:MAG: hypothetical protein ACFB22_07820 [Rhodothalassiaceae bacterium]